MPEVVYPSDNRTWEQVFPDIPDGSDDWACISDILYAIALNNRFGGKTTHQLRTEITERVTETRTRDGETVYAMYQKYIPLVFDNLGGAYREYKRTNWQENHTKVK